MHAAAFLSFPDPKNTCTNKAEKNRGVTNQMIVKCSKKLKVCPFCGQQAVLDQNESELAGHGRYYALGCETKDCRGSVYREVAYHPEGMVSREIAAWNTRK